MIHKSHSKNELVKLIEVFKIDIKNPKKYKKTELSFILNDKLKLIDNIEPHEELCIYNIIDLRYYLSNINPKKILTIKEKNNVILICKKIKHFARNNFNLSATEYNSYEEIHEDAEYICKFGDIPSVRKSIKELNKNPMNPYEYKPIISEVMKKQLEQKERLKRTNIYKCEIKHGKFLITFD